MMTRSRLRLGPLAAPLRHCVAAVAMFAQCLMVIAPLSDAREAAPLPPSVSSILEFGNSHVAINADHGHQVSHDATTCPACIAQSLVAHVSRPVRAPVPDAGLRTSGEPARKVIRPFQYRSLLRSRAPPFVI
jgi:hypothetical protein